VLSSREPDKIITARRGSPIVIGIGEGETIIASDASAIVAYTQRVIYLDDNDIAILGIVTEGDHETAECMDDFITIPPSHPLVATIPAAVALQLFAYHVARLRGCEIDQPRNLAKSVTVE
jgi:glucosamine 6-phosphate synthetase-like amidotransferase/phosphosugar isomerase protein